MTERQQYYQAAVRQFGFQQGMSMQYVSVADEICDSLDRGMGTEEFSSRSRKLRYLRSALDWIKCKARDLFKHEINKNERLVSQFALYWLANNAESIPNYESLNAGIALIAVEYVFRVCYAVRERAKRWKDIRDARQKAKIQRQISTELNDWWNVVQEAIEVVFSKQREKTGTIHSYAQSFDVLRYARYLLQNSYKLRVQVSKLINKEYPEGGYDVLLAMATHEINDLKVDIFEQSSKPEKLEKCNEFDETEFDFQAPPQQTNIPQKQIYIDDQMIRIPLYPYDTIDTIWTRVAVATQIDKWKLTLVPLQLYDTITTSQMYNHTVQIQEPKDWQYNMLENVEIRFVTSQLEKLQFQPMKRIAQVIKRKGQQKQGITDQSTFQNTFLYYVLTESVEKAVQYAFLQLQKFLNNTQISQQLFQELDNQIKSLKQYLDLLYQRNQSDEEQRNKHEEKQKQFKTLQKYYKTQSFQSWDQVEIIIALLQQLQSSETPYLSEETRNQLEFLYINLWAVIKKDLLILEAYAKPELIEHLQSIEDLDMLEQIMSQYLKESQLSELASMDKQFQYINEQYFQAQSQLQELQEPFIEIKQLAYELEATFQVPNTTIPDLLNALQISKSAPFARMYSYVKSITNIREPIAPTLVSKPYEWNSALDIIGENQLLLVVSNLESPSIEDNRFTNVKEFAKVMIELQDTKQGISLYKLRCKLENLDEEERQETESYIIQHVVQSLQTVNFVSPISFRRNFLDGMAIVQLPKNQQFISREVFHEYAMNFPTIQDTMKFQERSTIYDEQVNLKFLLSMNTAAEAPKVETKVRYIENLSGDHEEYKQLAIDQSSQSKQLWSIRVTGALPSKQVANMLANKFQIALQIVRNTYQTWFFNFYCNICTGLQDFIASSKKYVDEIKFNRDTYIFEEIFGNYARRAGMKAQYLLDTDENMKTITDMLKKKVITEDGWLRFPVINPTEEQRKRNFLFYCTNKNKPNISLKENSGKTALYLPYIPSCASKPKEATKQYRTGTPLAQIPELIDTKPRTSTTILKPTRAVTSLQEAGELFKDLETLLIFTYLRNNANDIQQVANKIYTFVREGVVPSNSRLNRFPNANYKLLLAMKKALNISDLDWEAKFPQLIAQLQAKIQQNVTYSTGLDPEDLSQMLQQILEVENKSQNAATFSFYMDPRAWLHAIKQVFETNIVLFTQASTESGTLTCEYFERFRVVNELETYSKCVFLYINPGAEFDDLTTPSIEVIVLRKGKKSSQTIFEGLTQTTLQSIVNAMYPTKRIAFNAEQVNENYRLVSQNFDAFEKSRQLVYQHQQTQTIVTMYLDPCFNLNAVKTINNIPCTLQAAKSFYQNEFEYVIHNQMVIGLFKKFKQSVSEKVEYLRTFIPIEPAVGYNPQQHQPIYNIQQQSYLGPLQQQESFSYQFKLIEKYAICLRAYCLKLFSLWTSARNVEYNLETVQQWIQNFVVTRIRSTPPNVMNISPMFNIQESNVFVDLSTGVPKLQIFASNELESQRIRIKLAYFLMQTIKYNFLAIREYPNAVYIPNFYNYASAFQKSNQWTVYNSLEEYEDAQNGLINKYVVHETLQNVPYSYYVKIWKDGVYSIKLAVPIEDEDETSAALKAIQIQHNYKETKSVHGTLLFNRPHFVEMFANDKQRVEFQETMMQENANADDVVKLGYIATAQGTNYFVLLND